MVHIVDLPLFFLYNLLAFSFLLQVKKETKNPAAVILKLKLKSFPLAAKTRLGPFDIYFTFLIVDC